MVRFFYFYKMKNLFLLAFLLQFLSGIAQTTLDSLIKEDFLFMEELMTSPMPGLNIDAEYPGGNKFFEIKLKEKLSKRSLRKINRLDKDLVIKFIVEKDGSISNIGTPDLNDKKLEQDIERASKFIPKWAPKIVNGKPLPQNMSLPIKRE